MDLKQWLEGDQDYLTGVSIYARLPIKNPMLLKRFSQRETPALKNKLKYELLKHKNQELQPADPKIKKKTKQIQQNKEIDSPLPSPKKIDRTSDRVYMHDLPAELRPVLQQAHALFMENCSLKVELNQAPASENTFDLQRRIDDNFRKNALAWSKIDFFREKGYLPQVAPAPFSNLTPAQLVKRQAYKASQISKAKAYIKKGEKRLLQKNLDLKERQRIDARITAKKEKLLTFEAEALELAKLIDGNPTN